MSPGGPPLRKLQTYARLLFAGWTILLALSCWLVLRAEHREMLALAAMEARTSIDKDLLYRRWAAGHGGVYVPVTGQTPPNPYLAHVPERDITTPAGRQLTLVNPAYMTRQVHEMAKADYKVQGHLTSLSPLSSTNAPDPWEKETLAALTGLESEAAAVATINGQPFMRVMRRVITEESCLKCHGDQGYMEGDIRGGLSASVPLASYYAISAPHRRVIIGAHFAIWATGLVVFGFGFGRFRQVIAGQEATEAALRQSEEHFALAAESAGSGLWDWADVERDEQWWSDQRYRMLGYAPGEIPAAFSTLKTLAHPEDAPRLAAALEAHWARRVPYELECRLRCKNGEYRWFRGRGQASWDEAGRPRRMSGSMEDTTARKEAERALHQAALEWSAAMDATDDPIYLLDLNQCIIRANQAFGRMVGQEPAALVGRYIETVIHPEGEKTPCPVCQAQRTMRDAVIAMEADHPDNPAGRPIEINIKIVRDEKERPLSILMTLHDLTSSRQVVEEKVRLENMLRQAQKMEAIGTLAGGIAHDFNNILSPILGYTEMALEAQPLGSQTARDLQQVLAAGKRAKELVQQILTFSRQSDQELKPLKVQFVLKEALKLLRASIPTTITIREEISMDCGAVLADPTQIQQVVINLCTNAYQAMRDQGGTLAVALREMEIGSGDLIGKDLPAPGRYVCLEVRDTGPGIPREVVDRIFEPYFTTKKKGEGTGLGLAMVHGIVKSLGGTVTVYSEPGRGAEFHVYLPLTRREEATDISLTTLLPTGSERLLLIDDEPMTVTVMEHLLRSLGYQVTAFTDSEEALAVFQGQPDDFDLVVTDMTMPGKTGEDVARQVMARRPEMPIIICTGFSQTMDAGKAKALGIRQFIMKPVIRSELALAVRTALDRGSLPS